jgi:hypothetical protein
MADFLFSGVMGKVDHDKAVELYRLSKTADSYFGMKILKRESHFLI